ncbi:MAG: hypothetical protein IPO90_15890 [Flavobacteriales bacterium]|nr:hypothetical protein [Flavobacteriales bacterium]
MPAAAREDGPATERLNGEQFGEVGQVVEIRYGEHNRDQRHQGEHHLFQCEQAFDGITFQHEQPHEMASNSSVYTSMKRLRARSIDVYLHTFHITRPVFAATWRCLVKVDRHPWPQVSRMGVG